MKLFIYNFILLGLQGPSGTDAPPPPRPGYVVYGPQDPVPIDDHIWVLLAVGVLFGIYMAYKRNFPTNKAS